MRSPPPSVQNEDGTRIAVNHWPTHRDTQAASANERLKKEDEDEKVILGVGILFEEWERETLDASRG